MLTRVYFAVGEFLILGYNIIVLIDTALLNCVITNYVLTRPHV